MVLGWFTVHASPVTIKYKMLRVEDEKKYTQKIHTKKVKVSQLTALT